MGKYFSNSKYLTAMVGKNSNKVNDKEKKKKKEKKMELTKDRICKVVGASNHICLNCLETKSKSIRRSL